MAASLATSKNVTATARAASYLSTEVSVSSGALFLLGRSRSSGQRCAGSGMGSLIDGVAEKSEWPEAPEVSQRPELPYNAAPSHLASVRAS